MEPNKGDKRYVQRGKKGKFTSHQVDVGSISRSTLEGQDGRE
jgi:hypothetical protein